MTTGNLDAFLKDVERALGAENVSLVEETIKRYGEHTLPADDRRPGAVVYPGSTAEVQAVVRAANAHKVPIFPVSTGNNMGLGTRAPVKPGQVVVDLGKRMNRILEIDETLGFAAVEPGVSFQMMADELVRRGGKYIISTTSGPPQGGMLGNALDKGAGYGPMFDHFGMSCGMEIVLGNGEVIRTGDGSIDHPNAPNWHVSKYSFGPILDGLFAQSNFGIVTRMGIWLMPKPPAIRSFHFAFPDDHDLEQIVELCRPLKLANFVPTLFRVANDLYLIGTEDTYPGYATNGGKASISAEQRKALQAKHGVGAWTVSGAFYGPSMEAMEPQINRVKQHFTQSGKAKYISHEEALGTPPLKIAIDSFSGVPTLGELGLLKWRPGGGNSWAPPGTPMLGKIAGKFEKAARAIYEKHGLDYMIMNVCSSRFMRGLHVISFNRESEDERRRADAVYREICDAFAAEGVSVGRAPTDYYDFHMAKLTPAFRNACNAIKQALDPNGIIAPGKYGIG
ncbi:MAG: FAD-binding oxidoreductase [Rhodospirillaceae bacterium]|nr:FAD-binding oxidoreductase [Rhodospirillaceae bacterium]